MKRCITVNDFTIGEGAPLALIAGPCVIENFDVTRQVAVYLKRLTGALQIPFIFKASYDKANRTSIDAFRGPGLEQGLEILARIKSEVGVPILSDVHSVQEVAAAARVLDVIQIPALLCRQTDLITAAAATGKPVNIKKGQFQAPWDMGNVVRKVTESGNHDILITERGSLFGYNNLVVDFRAIRILQDMGLPVVFDATHSVQLPGGAGTRSSGQREYAPLLANAAVAAGADAIFMEVHPEPDKALCDGPNSLPLDTLESVLRRLLALRQALSPALDPGPVTVHAC